MSEYTALSAPQHQYARPSGTAFASCGFHEG